MSINKKKVAIIGGGIAGLSCAKELSQETNRFEVTVYDTGRLRPGGRSSSRQMGDSPKDDDDNAPHYPLLAKFRYDHAAQLIAKPSSEKYPAFHKQLQEWLAQGIVKEFPPESVCQLSQGGKVQPIVSQTFYHATEGMGNLATSLAKCNTFRLEQDVWVSPSSGVRYQKNSGQWKLQAKGKTLGYYDELIIAHNGKCADRIMSQTPATELHNLLRVNFSPTVPENGGNKMTLNSLYSLTIVMPKNSDLSRALPEPFQCGFLNHPQLRMISCQTRKYPITDQTGSDESLLSYEVWNILSSAKFAKKYKGPQEALPPETIDHVTALLLEATKDALGLGASSQSSSLLEPLEARLQLWGAAVPLNVWAQDFLWDSTYNVGVCGDWLVEPSIAGAYSSGHALAQHLRSSSPPNTHGLHEGTFVRSEGSSQLGLAALTLKTNKVELMK
jgi:predicted NAD/FAD-dependent oxidoreductase